MSFWTGIFIGCFGAIVGSQLSLAEDRDKMCSGVPVVVEKAELEMYGYTKE